MQFDNIKSKFQFLNKKLKVNTLIYLDSANSSQNQEL